jgi:hypothetical protein
VALGRLAGRRAGLALALGSGALPLSPCFHRPLLLVALPLLLWLLAGGQGLLARA